MRAPTWRSSRNVGIFLSGILLLRLVIAIARDGLGLGDR